MSGPAFYRRSKLFFFLPFAADPNNLFEFVFANLFDLAHNSNGRGMWYTVCKPSIAKTVIFAETDP